MKSALHFQLRLINRNRTLFMALLLIAGITLCIGVYHHTPLKSVTYLLAMWACAFLIDLYALWKPVATEFTVRNPERETGYVLLCTGLGYLFLFVRFSGQWEGMNGLLKLLFLPLILFVFPVALAAIFLLLKYRPVDLGFRRPVLWAAWPVILVVASAGLFIAPQDITWRDMIAEEGLLGLLFTGFITAALSEELWRVLAQTRLGALFRHTGWGWFLATVIWAFMHAPKWYYDGRDLEDALISSIRIIPIGLMWGYLTHRTKSIFPALLAHGTNVWGLQNF